MRIEGVLRVLRLLGPLGLLGLMGPLRLLRLLGGLRPLGGLRLLGLLVPLGVLGVLGCSSEDSEEDEAEQDFPVEVMGVVTPFEEAETSETTGATEATGAAENTGATGAAGAAGATEATGRAETTEKAGRAEATGVTRAWNPPTGYDIMDDQTIGVFMTKDDAEPMQGYFYKGGGKWHTTLEITEATTYYLYGYRPHSSGVTSTIAKYEDNPYSSGAVLTIRNLPSVTANDVCVVVGAKNGYNNGYSENGDYSNTNLRRGDFAYAAQATGNNSNSNNSANSNNYVFLLFDHLYSSFRVRMKVAPEYNSLRTIKLKELRLKTSAGNTPTKKRLDATVTLHATADASTNPITSVTFTPVGDDEGDGTMFSTSEPLALTTEYSAYVGYFMPTGVDKLELTSIYDVYDKKGYLTRENCKATNSIDITKIFDRQTEALRGYRYSINMVIQPTYLYVLSDPDLDNPTVMIDN